MSKRVLILLAVVLVLVLVGCESSTAPRATALFRFTTSGLNLETVNESTGASYFSWSFGDSSGGSRERSPVHRYIMEGEYQVSLRACPDENFEGTSCDSTSALVTVTDLEGH